MQELEINRLQLQQLFSFPSRFFFPPSRLDSRTIFRLQGRLHQTIQRPNKDLQSASNTSDIETLWLGRLV